MIFTQEHAIVTVLAADADRYNTDPATDIVTTQDFRHVTWFLIESAGATGTVKIQVEECTDNAGAGATAIGFNYRVGTNLGVFGAIVASAAAGYTTVAGADKIIAIELDAAELSDGSDWARLQLTEVVDSPVDARILPRPRVAPGRVTGFKRSQCWGVLTRQRVICTPQQPRLA